jgi:CubicO group peptidase (beta-lactamase class C family)
MKPHSPARARCHSLSAWQESDPVTDTVRLPFRGTDNAFLAWSLPRMYHVSIDLLGVLIARVSGQSLGAFLRERVFDPLGMKDTRFFARPEKIERVPVCYFFNRQTGAATR